jgi:hypothetical protein
MLKHHTMKNYGEWWYNIAAFLSFVLMEMSNKNGIAETSAPAGFFCKVVHIT